MSRIGNKPITVPAGVEVTLNGNHITVKGPKGTLEKELHKNMEVSMDGNVITVKRPNDEGELKYDTIDQFLNDNDNNPIEDGQREYTEAFVIPCTSEQDRAAELGAKVVLSEDYNVLFSNCAQTVQNALDKAGLNDGNVTRYTSVGLPYKDRIYIPNNVYSNIKMQNKNGYVYAK